uniref:PNMA family member 6F n=1 Tax=Molossus molossus TaxID=27622 RepID=A0A7J8J7F6_MOLMO|nr:PNMA family member 6F [Molossus molossus]
MTIQLKFMTCAQQPQETLFACDMPGRPAAGSHGKGAIHPAIADQVRNQQVLMRARPNEKLQNKLKRMRLERRPPGFLGMLRLSRESEAWEATSTMSQQFQVQEGACVGTGDLAAAQAAPAHDVAQAAPAHEDAAQAALSKEDCAEASLANAGAIEAGPATASPKEAAPETRDATGADPAPEKTTKASPATQREKNALALAGLGQAGSSPAHVGSAFGVGPGGPGSDPEGLAQEGGQEVEKPMKRGSSPSQRSQKGRTGLGR